MDTVCDIDLTDLDLFTHGDVHGMFARLRKTRPVHWNQAKDGTAFWALTRHRDVASAYADPIRLSSRFGTLLGGSYRRASDSAGGQMLVASDSPEHRLLRQQMHRAFAPGMLKRAAAVIRANLHAALDQMVADGGADFAQIALEMPAGVLAAMYGLDRDEAFHLLRLTRILIGFRDPLYLRDADAGMTLVRSQVEILDLMHDLAVRRRRQRGSDLISILISARLNGRPMTDDQVLYNGLNVAVGGNETTPFTAAAAIEAFIEHPDQLDRLYANPALAQSALNEIFRWTSTSAFVQRTANVDLEIDDTRIEAGQSVTLWNISANRDETVFADPDRFDIGRNPNRQLAFGVGEHRCIGMATAWMEFTILFDELINRGLRCDLAGPIQRLRSNFIVGPTSLPVRVTGTPTPCGDPRCLRSASA